MGATVSDVFSSSSGGNALEELGQALQQRGDLTTDQANQILRTLARFVREGVSVTVFVPGSEKSEVISVPLSDGLVSTAFSLQTLIPASPTGTDLEIFGG